MKLYTIKYMLNGRKHDIGQAGEDIGYARTKFLMRYPEANLIFIHTKIVDVSQKL